MSTRRVPDAYFRRGRRDGMTYVIGTEHGGPVKIGSTLIDVDKRLATIQANSPAKLRVRAAFKGIHVEDQLHKRFSSYRLHGEWFDLCESEIVQLEEEAANGG